MFSTGDGVWTRQAVTFDPAGDNINAIWGAGPDAVYACTQRGFVYRSNGAGQWSAAEPIVPGGVPICYDMWGTATNNIYVALTTGIRRGTH